MTNSKYRRQINNARRIIAAKGTFCTWTKEGVDSSSTLPPEMQNYAEPTAFTGTPIVFIPATRKEMFTAVLEALGAYVSNQDIGIIPGDVPFSPANGDNVAINGEERYVDRVNKVAPDGVAIIYEITFK